MSGPTLGATVLFTTVLIGGAVVIDEASKLDLSTPIARAKDHAPQVLGAAALVGAAQLVGRRARRVRSAPTGLGIASTPSALLTQTLADVARRRY